MFIIIFILIQVLTFFLVICVGYRDGYSTGFSRGYEQGVGDMAQAIVPRCARYGYATTTALTDNGATIGTPILIRVFGSTMEGAISTVPSLTGNIYKIDGSIVIPPGYALLSYTFAIQTSSIQFHFVWEEVDL
jgi:hypothetical protein